jgi:hypothetical protein
VALLLHRLWIGHGKIMIRLGKVSLGKVRFGDVRHYRLWIGQGKIMHGCVILG